MNTENRTVHSLLLADLVAVNEPNATWIWRRKSLLFPLACESGILLPTSQLSNEQSKDIGSPFTGALHYNEL